MTTGRAPTPVFGADWAVFAQGGVSIVAASRDAANTPILARSVGCRITPRGDAVTLLLPVPQADRLLAAIRVSRAIAVVFSEPSTHRTIQLKGVDAQRSPVRSTDADIARRYVDAFAAEVDPLGYPPPFSHALMIYDPEHLAAVRFTPDRAFLQTPGPRAGDPLRQDD